MLDSCFRFSEEKKRHYYSEVCKLQILSPRVPKLASVTESQFFKACEALFCVLMEKKKKIFGILFCCLTSGSALVLVQRYFFITLKCLLCVVVFKRRDRHLIHRWVFFFTKNGSALRGTHNLLLTNDWRTQYGLITLKQTKPEGFFFFFF